jgi:hypothetical protein
MADSEHSSSGTKAEDGDPLLAFAAAVRDMWLFGASTLENVLAQGNPRADQQGNPQAKTDAASASFAPYVEQMIRAGSAFRDLTAANTAALAGSQDAEGAPRDLLAFMARANLIASAGGLRYWRKLAQIYAARQANILRSLSAGAGDPGHSQEGRRALVEEVRGYLREIGDVSLQEARAFQSELETLAADLATAAETPDESSEYRRRWKAKP